MSIEQSPQITPAGLKLSEAKPTSLLRVENLEVRYGGIRALRGLSLCIEPGEIVIVTGPNGAGKSTLMNSLAGLIKPQGGSIWLDGENITHRAAERIARLGLSMVPEGRHVFGAMTVLENLRIGMGARSDIRTAPLDLDYVMDLFPLLRERAHTQAGLLSGGQQQMLVIARGLMTAPRLLAIDEPSLGLAPLITDQVYDALLRLRRERALTLLIVEQSATRAAMVGARMLMLREGQVVLSGDPRTMSAQEIERAYFGFEA
jgi:branched-chain amino acid transport system ATP-binding protein